MASLLSCSVSILPRGAASFNRKNTIKQRNVVHKKASIVVTSKLSEDKTKVALGQKAVAALAAAMLFVSPPAFAADKVALQAKGRVFAEASAAVRGVLFKSLTLKYTSLEIGNPDSKSYC
jgi:hypothetical protein